MNSRLRWIPAKTLGQNPFVSAPTTVMDQPVVSAQNTGLMNKLMYGGMILAGLALIWAVTTSRGSE